MYSCSCDDCSRPVAPYRARGDETVEPRPGYYLLSKNTTLLADDEFWSHSRQAWLPTEEVGALVGRYPADLTYRRKLPTADLSPPQVPVPEPFLAPKDRALEPGDGYRFVGLDEVLVAGDEVWYRGQQKWYRSVYSGTTCQDAGRGELTYRREVVTVPVKPEESVKLEVDFMPIAKVLGQLMTEANKLRGELLDLMAEVKRVQEDSQK